MMQNWGWEPGKELGRNVTPTADMVETSEEFTAASHPHFFQRWLEHEVKEKKMCMAV